MKRILATTILFCVPAALYGQGQPVFQALFTNRSVGPIHTAPVTNQGQTGHIVFVVAADAPGKTCNQFGASTQLRGSLEFSYDAAVWYQFGAPNSSSGLSGLKTLTFFGSGLYKYVRFTLFNFDATNCVVSAFYTGSFTSPLQLIAGKSSNDVNNGISYTPIAACDQVTGVSPLGAGLTALPIVGPPVRICSIVLSNTSATATTVQFSGSNDGCVSSGTLGVVPIVVPANGTVVWGSGLGQVLFSPTHPNICVASPAGTDLHVNVTFMTGN